MYSDICQFFEVSLPLEQTKILTDMNFEDLKTNIHNKIKNDELEDVIELLISNFSNSNYFNELLQQSANIHKLNGDRRKNLMSYDQQMIERSKIRNSIIELFDNIEQELNGDDKIEPEPRDSYSKITTITSSKNVLNGNISNVTGNIHIGDNITTNKQ